MARTGLSNTIKAAMYSQQTDKIFLTLLVIDHAEMDLPLRFVDNNEIVNSNGEDYTPYPFVVDWPPPDDADTLPTVQLTIDNIDRSIIQELRELETAPTIDVSLVLADDHDTVELGPLPFVLQSIDYNAQTITAELGFEHVLQEPFPAHTFTPTNFPGLF